jgi:hypothetical protein
MCVAASQMPGYIPNAIGFIDSGEALLPQVRGRGGTDHINRSSGQAATNYSFDS